MAKEKNGATGATEPTTGGEIVLHEANQFEALFPENVASEQMVEMSASYLKMAEGEEREFIFTGFTTATIQEKPTECVTLFGKKGESFIFAGAAVVNSCKRLKAPCYVRFQHRGTKDLGGGKKLADIAVLALPDSIAN